MGTSMTFGSCALGLATTVLAQPATFHGIGQMPGWATGTTIAGISADGSVTAGTARELRYVGNPVDQTTFVYQAFTLSDGEFHALDTRTEMVIGSIAGTISKDGRVVLGAQHGGSVAFGARWVESHSIE